MPSIAFATPPPSLLPASLKGAQLNEAIALDAATREADVSAEGLSVRRASARVAAPPLAEGAEGAEAPSDDVVEVQLAMANEPPLDAMTVKQLRAYAAERDISLVNAANKKAIVAKIRSAA